MNRSPVPCPPPAALFGIHPDELAVFCRVFRRLRGMEQRAMAKACGISASSLCRLEKGETSPSVASYVALVTWLAKEVGAK